MLKEAAEVKGIDSFPNLEKMPWMEEMDGERAQLSPRASASSLLGDWSRDSHTTAFQQPLPHAAAILQGLLLNIAPAFQTDRRAPAVYTGELNLHTLLIW